MQSYKKKRDFECIKFLNRFQLTFHNNENEKYDYLCVKNKKIKTTKNEKNNQHYQCTCGNWTV